MMIWRELFGGQTTGLDRVRQQLLEMLEIDRRTFDIACAPLLAGADVGEAKRAASESDHEVNQRVQEVRRELVVHASARGDMNDMPTLLVYMSIVKDIERIGDYAKNILDIARAGGDLSSQAGALVSADTSASHAVPRALYYRYLKRIIGHLMNILTALVMPLDKLDFFWEEHEADQ